MASRATTATRRRSEGLPHIYEPHVAAWASASTPLTTLWFWNTELGWATVHPTIEAHGWRFRNCHVWDKGIAHASGNSNTQTLRKLPVVTEVCVQYVQGGHVRGRNPNVLDMQAWLRHEWLRTGLPALPHQPRHVASKTRRPASTLPPTICGITRPSTPSSGFVAYRQRAWGSEPAGHTSLLDGHDADVGRSVGADAGQVHVPAGRHQRLAATRPSGEPSGCAIDGKVLHTNQKPLALMDLTVEASSDPGDVVWEPFGGSVLGVCLGGSLWVAVPFAAECQRPFYQASVRRVRCYAGPRPSPAA